MRKMRFGVVLAVGLMACAGAMARAQETEQAPAAAAALPEDQQATKEQIAKLFEVMRLRQQMDTMMKMVPAMAQQTAQQQMKAMRDQMPAGSKLTAEQQEALDKMMQRIIEKAIASYPIDGVIADATTVYQRHIRREDADAMIAFYSSPAGQHLLDAQPVIAREYMPMVMARMQEVNKGLAAEVSKEVKDYIAALPAAKN
jgi:uncharacterized protein